MLRIEDLDVEQVAKLLEDWQLQEFQEFVCEKQVDGRKLVDVTEGLVKLWRPKVNAKKLILFIEDLKVNPDKYFGETQKDLTETQAECQYRTVKKTKSESSTATVTVEELLKKLVPAKSFLYRNQSKQVDKIPSYLPMDAGTKKTRKFFRLSSYEYPNFDIFSRFSKIENQINSEIQEDRGYYSVKMNSRYFIHKTNKKPELRTKYKSLPTSEELPDHFYEDLCYNDVTKKKDNKLNDLRQPVNVKPRLVKLQELFNSFKMPFCRKPVQTVQSTDSDAKIAETVNHKANEINYYENGDIVGNMYDSVHVHTNSGENKNKTVSVDEYLEPVCVDKEYCDISVKQKEESLLGYIMSLFEHRFGIRRETSDPNQSEESENEENTNENNKTPQSDENKMAPQRFDRASVSNKMADRPLPVPVENEPYYMNVDRAEAENLLRGMPDGTFILRPSSQSNHAYTLSVSCANAVHNVGVRRRPDGRLALGFARRGERSFLSVPALLRHHRRARLLLVAAGGVLGATTLTESPHYYQTPTNIPIVSSQ